MAEYKKYLASSILTENKIITYRILSRALKVNVNVAKEMLYEFHKLQNAKKSGTIHATYLLGGTKQKEATKATNGDVKKDGEDDYMQSSPFMSSMPQTEEGTGESSTLTITLVREENLEEVRSQYDHINSIHVYSIGPHPLKDLQVLSDATRELQELCVNEDPLEFASKYGTIVNQNAKRRTGKRPPPPAPVAAPVAVAKPVVAPKVAPKPEPKASKPSSANDFFGKSKEKPKPAEKATENPPSKESTPNPPTLKRESSSIFKSFAKAKPKIKREETESSATDSPAAEDSPMKDVDDDDDEEDTWAPEPTKPAADIVDKDRKSRKEREEALKKMMDENDEDEPVAPPAVEEAEEVEEKEASVEKEVPPVVSHERRRGRRRVMKKKTVKDEEGYLVTKEEPVWESFSEDEPAEKPKPRAQFAPAAAKPKKGAAAKAGQGSIMSFFGKK